LAWWRQTFFVDVLTHGIVVSLLLVSVNAELLLFAGILGSVAPDLDVLLSFISSRNPQLYILIHGGITHSLAGGILASLLLFGIALAIAIPFPFLSEGGIVVRAAALVILLAGTLLHLLLDLMAFPGIPLWYPISDRKYTLGIFPGPSLFLFGLSVLFLIPFFVGLIGPGAFRLYAVIFLIFILFCSALKILISYQVKGTTVPTRNPLKWLVLTETDNSFRVLRYHLGRGAGAVKDYLKYDGVSRDEISGFLDLAELKRLYYHSYIVTVRKEGKNLVFRDPLRDDKIIFYPPYYTKVTVRNTGK
jgi:inner membrane protein